jgi:glucokinase
MSDNLEQAGRRVGIEISSSAFTAVCLESDGSVSAAKRVPADPSQPAADGLGAFLNESKKDFGHFERIGIAVPGLVERGTGRVSISTNIPEHSNIDLISEIRSGTGLHAVIENDANAAAYGEFRLGAGRGSRDMFYATLGEGVGGAFIFDGAIWRGSAGFAGEFGYIPIDSEGTKLEDVASTASIIRRTRSRFHQDSTSSLSRLSEEGITISEIIAAADKEDGFAQMMLERTGTYVGVALATVINLLNIGKIVIGGEIIQTKQLVLDAIIEHAGRFSFTPSFESTSIVEGELGENAAAIGAALLSSEAE